MTQPRRILDLRQATKPAPPKPAPAKPARTAAANVGEWTKAGPRVGPPIPVGQVVRALSDGEQFVIDSLGIPPGDLPPDLAKELQAVVRGCPELWAEGLPDGVDPNRAPLPPLTEIPLDKLPREKQAKIQDFVQNYRIRLEEERELARTYNPAAPPGVNDAVRLGKSSPNQFATIEDDLPDKRKPVAAQPQTSPPPTTTESEPFSAGGDLQLRHCPHCDWDLTKLTDALVLTDTDKLAFKAAMLTGDRYRKSYTLLGGSLVVGFRDLTSAEADLAMRQVTVDTREALGQKDVPEESTLWGNLASYRLVMGLDFIEREGQRTDIPFIHDPDLQLDPPKAPSTKLVPYHTAIIEMCLPSDSLRAIVGDQYHLFGLYIQKMRASAHSANF